MLPRVAAVTMAYNEAAYLPVWCRHYARQVGADQCYVVDHGSSEAVIVAPGVNVIRLPRSPHNDANRAAFIASLVAGLLRYYDWVVHTDVDELVLADPVNFPNLPAFCATATADSITTIGLDVQHVPVIEAALDVRRAIGQQRSWARFTSAMCKPALTRRPLTWSPGFHTAGHTPAFGELYLFHLHWADRTIGLERLAKTRAMPWDNAGHGAHQRIDEGEWSAMFTAMAAMPRCQPPFDRRDKPLSDWLDRTLATAQFDGQGVGAIDLGLNAAELWAIPEWFRARL